MSPPQKPFMIVLPALSTKTQEMFMLVLEGEIEFTFERGKRTIVKAGECFTLPKHVNHHCVFKKLTIAIEGVHKKGL
jgi:quercetin dioxygenase-like cupin family protein